MTGWQALGSVGELCMLEAVSSRDDDPFHETEIMTAPNHEPSAITDPQHCIDHLEFLSGVTHSVHNMHWLCDTCHFNKKAMDWLEFFYR
jgi:hypothetical protein